MSDRLLQKEPRCDTCEFSTTIDDCVKEDLREHVYYQLAAVLFDSKQVKNCSDFDSSEKILLLHARILADNPQVLYMVLRKIYRYMRKYCRGNYVEDYQRITAQNGLHKQREIIFISSVIKEYQEKKGGEMMKLLETLKQPQDFTDNLKAIIFSDIRFARLLPLFHIITHHRDSDFASILYTNFEDKSKRETSSADNNAIIISILNGEGFLILFSDYYNNRTANKNLHVS